MEAAQALSRCWRKDEAHDPDGFAMAMTAVLSTYAPEVVWFCCDPRAGIATRQVFPPSLSEVHAFCQEHVRHLEMRRQYENWGAEEINDMPNDDRPSADDLKAKYPPNWGLGDPARRPINEVLADAGHPPHGTNSGPPHDRERLEASRQWLENRRKDKSP